MFILRAKNQEDQQQLVTERATMQAAIQQQLETERATMQAQMEAEFARRWAAQDDAAMHD